MSSQNYNIKVSRTATYSELTTSNKTLTGSINELAQTKQPLLTSGATLKTVSGQTLLGSGNVDITIVQSAFITTHNITNNILGIAQSIKKLKMSFKKGNNIYNMGSINNTLIPTNTVTVDSFGTTFRCYLDSSNSLTLGTNITATYTNGTKQLVNVDTISMSFPNINTLLLTFRDNTATPARIFYDISGLA